MDIKNFEIETNSISDKVGQEVTKLSDEDIAKIISTGISLTGYQGLSGLAASAEDIAQQAGEFATNSPEMIVNIILSELDKLMADTGVLDALQIGLNATSNTVELGKNGLAIAKSSATYAANIAKLLTMINGVQDVDITMVPSVKDHISIIGQSLKNIIMAKYLDARQQLIVLYNSMICTSNDAAIDNAVASINNIIDVAGPMLDPIMQEYTGYTTSEARFLCNQGLTYVAMLKRVKSRKRTKQQDNTTNEQEIIEQ